MALIKAKDGSLIVGSKRKPAGSHGKGALVRRRSCCVECMFLITELSMKKSIPKPCKSLEGFSCCCLDTIGSAPEELRETLVGTARNTWGMKKLFSLFPWANSSLQVGSGAAAALVLIPWLCTQIPGVDPRVLPRTGSVPVPWSHPVLVVPNNALTSLSPSVNWGALEGVFSYFS